MSEQDQVPQGSIPPKVSPFAKPEGASPLTPATPGSPRPITVRLKPIAPAAGVQPVAQPQQDEGEQVTATPLSANPRVTARVPIPNLSETDTVSSVAAPVPPPAAFTPVAPATVPPPAAITPAAPATVRLRPVSQQGAAASAAPAAVTPVMTPMQPTPPPTPGSHPLPDGPKPPSGAQVQAAKSKTSRISLDSAIGAPMGGDKAEPKTIRLKRPADLAAPAPKVSTAPIRQTSRIPDSALPPVEAASVDASTVTQKKTLKIKRPGMSAEAAAASAAEGDAFPDVQMVALDAMDLPSESKVFTLIAVAAAAACVIASLLLTWCLGAHAVGPVAGKNSVATITGPELPWAGRISE